MTGALVIFVLSYIAIAAGRVPFLGLDRPAAAVVGAVAMAVFGGLPLQAALDAINLHVLVLLFGVLVIAAYLAKAHFFRFVAYLVLTRMKSARTLLVALTFVAGAFSAFLVNDTVCVVLTPLVVAVVIETRLPALPYLLALSGAANVGGVVSFSGNPQNMIIGEAAHGAIGFAQYFALVLPVGVVCLAANSWLLSVLFRRELQAGTLGERAGTPAPELDRVLAAKGLGALALFAVLALCGVELAGAAMAAAAALMLAARTASDRSGHDVVRGIDWSLLAFFAGLFVVVAGVEHAGVLDRVFGAVSPWLARGDALGTLALVAIVVVGSQLVSNVPLVAIAVHWMPRLPDPVWGYIVLAVASTLAGNLTLLGSVANIIVFEWAGPHGKIRFGTFFRYGLVITLVDLVLAFAILGGERALGVPGWLGL